MNAFEGVVLLMILIELLALLSSPIIYASERIRKSHIGIKRNAGSMILYVVSSIEIFLSINIALSLSYSHVEGIGKAFVLFFESLILFGMYYRFTVWYNLPKKPERDRSLVFICLSVLFSVYFISGIVVDKFVWCSLANKIIDIIAPVLEYKLSYLSIFAILVIVLDILDTRLKGFEDTLAHHFED